MSADALALLRAVLHPGLWPVERGIAPADHAGSRDMHVAHISPRRMAQWRAQLAELDGGEVGQS